MKRVTALVAHQDVTLEAFASALHLFFAVPVLVSLLDWQHSQYDPDTSEQYPVHPNQRLNQ